MELTILTHIILGSILTLSIIFTAFFLLGMFFTTNAKKTMFKTRFQKSAIITVILFIIYFGWIFIKNLFF